MTGLPHIPLYLAVFTITLLKSTANSTMTGVNCIALMNNMQDLSVFSAVFRRLLFAPGFSRWEKGNTLFRTKPASAGLLDPLQQRRGQRQG
jgi:hypothetical protein